tara:strand:+ start:1210 stop:1503 length:294 start_codon:yes stop_codon:yes gene_type:complete
MPYPIYWLITNILSLYMLVIFIWVILSWLVAFNVINPYNRFVGAIIQGTGALVDPALRPIRRILPTLGGMDFSPIVLLLLVQFLKVLVQWIYLRAGF